MYEFMLADDTDPSRVSVSLGPCYGKPPVEYVIRLGVYSSGVALTIKEIEQLIEALQKVLNKHQSDELAQAMRIADDAYAAYNTARARIAEIKRKAGLSDA